MPYAVETYQRVIAPLIAASARKRCLDYRAEITKAQKVEGLSSEDRDMLLLFDCLCAYMLVPSSPTQVFQPLMVLSDGRRSALPEDLQQDQIDFLAELVQQIDDPEMRSRVADTLWVLKHTNPAVYAKIAIESYQEAALALDKEPFTFCHERFERAVRLYISTGSKKGMLTDKNPVTQIATYLNAASAEDAAPYDVIGLVKVLLESRQAESTNYIKLITNLAERLEGESNYNAARDAWHLASDLNRKAKNTDASIEADKRGAETFVKLADAAEAEASPTYMNICSWLQNAVTAYQKLPDCAERRKEIYQRLTQSQPRIYDEMQSFSYEADVTEEVERARTHVSGQVNTLEALKRFAFIMRPPKIAKVMESLAKQNEIAPFTAIISGTFHNEKGHVVSRQDSDDPTEARIFTHVSRFYRSPFVTAYLRPALSQIRLEHTASLTEWAGFLQHHPFVPPDRIAIYAHGLFNGFYGDFLTAAHILTPQLENSIRYILEQEGLQTSKPVEGGLQEEMGLQQLLKMDELKRMLGEDIVFDLRGLLIEKTGDNFRHRISHGLASDDELLSELPVYLYWLVIHLIFLPLASS